MKPKKIAMLLAVSSSLALFTGCSLPTTRLTGNKIINAENETLMIQSNVSMDDNNINSMTGGKIKEVYINEGDAVSEGQTLAIIDSDSLVAKKNQILAQIETLNGQLASAVAGKSAAEASLKKAQNGAREEEIQQVKTALDSAQSNYDRTKTLCEAGASTEVNLESAKTQLDLAQSKYDLAIKGAVQEDIDAASANVDKAIAGIDSVNGQIKAAQAQLEELNVSMEYTILTAPSSGIVTKLNVSNGDMVSSGMPLMVVTETSDPSITCNVKETDLNKITLNQEVSIKLSATGDTVYSGKVVSINKNADFAVKKATNDNGEFDILSYGVKVKFDNLDGLNDILRAGMTAFVDFGK